MNVRIYAALIFCAVCFPAFADPVTVSTTPLVDALSPYVNLIVPPIVMGIMGWLAIQLQQWAHIQIQASLLEKLKSAAATEAGILVANAEDDLKGRSINIGSAGVATAANNIIAKLPDAVKAVGATPEALQTIVVGEIGKLQSAGTVVPEPLKVKPE